MSYVAAYVLNGKQIREADLIRTAMLIDHESAKLESFTVKKAIAVLLKRGHVVSRIDRDQRGCVYVPISEA